MTLQAPPRASNINLLTTLVARAMEMDGLTEAEADLAVKLALGLVSDTEAPTSSPTGTPTVTTMSPTLDVDSDLPQCLSGCAAALLAPLEVRVVALSPPFPALLRARRQTGRETSRNHAAGDSHPPAHRRCRSRTETAPWPTAPSAPP